MSKVLVTESYLEDIADAIRSKNGESVNYTPSEMAEAIEDIETGGTLGTKSIIANGSYNASSDGYDGYSSVSVNVPSSTLGTKSIASNGTYDASNDNLDGYSQVEVNVPNSYSASDEGKVVSSGALVAQTSRNVTENGTYDTTTNDEVVVNVSGGGSTLISKTITQNGTYDPTDDNADGYNEVIVNVSSGGDSGHLMHFDFTKSLVDEISGVTAILSGGCSLGSSGLIFDNSSQNCQIPRCFIPNIKFDVQFGAIDFKGVSNYNTGLIMFGSNSASNGLLRRSNGKLAFYISSWTEFQAIEIDDLAYHKLSIITRLNKTTALIDDVEVGSVNTILTPSAVDSNFNIGNARAASSGGQLFDAIVESADVYYLPVE